MARARSLRLAVVAVAIAAGCAGRTGEPGGNPAVSGGGGAGGTLHLLPTATTTADVAGAGGMAAVHVVAGAGGAHVSTVGGTVASGGSGGANLAQTDCVESKPCLGEGTACTGFGFMCAPAVLTCDGGEWVATTCDPTPPKCPGQAPKSGVPCSTMGGVTCTYPIANCPAIYQQKAVCFEGSWNVQMPTCQSPGFGGTGGSGAGGADLGSAGSCADRTLCPSDQPSDSAPCGGCSLDANCVYPPGATCETPVAIFGATCVHGSWSVRPTTCD